jgi:hypothetical protein
MKTRYIIWGSLILGIPIFVLAASVFYKGAIGYYAYQKNAAIWLGPYPCLREPLEHKPPPKLPKVDVVTLHGVSLPAEWQPEFSETDFFFTRFTATWAGANLNVAAQKVSLQDWVDEACSGFVTEAWGSLDAFQDEYSDDEALLEDVADQTLSRHVLKGSFLRPLFPWPRNYQRSFAIKVVKTGLFPEKLVKYEGEQYYFYVVRRESDHAWWEICVGDLSDGSMLGRVIVSVDAADVTEDLGVQMCAALDAGSFTPPSPKQPTEEDALKPVE